MNSSSITGKKLSVKVEYMKVSLVVTGSVVPSDLDFHEYFEEYTIEHADEDIYDLIADADCQEIVALAEETLRRTGEMR